jgi:hypothetical protein
VKEVLIMEDNQASQIPANVVNKGAVQEAEREAEQVEVEAAVAEVEVGKLDELITMVKLAFGRTFMITAIVEVEMQRENRLW